MKRAIISGMYVIAQEQDNPSADRWQVGYVPHLRDKNTDYKQMKVWLSSKLNG